MLVVSWRFVSDFFSRYPDNGINHLPVAGLATDFTPHLGSQLSIRCREKNRVIVLEDSANPWASFVSGCFTISIFIDHYFLHYSEFEMICPAGYGAVHSDQALNIYAKR